MWIPRGKRAGEGFNGDGGSVGQSRALVRERRGESQPTQAATRRRLYLHDKDRCGTSLLVEVLEVRRHQCFVPRAGGGVGGVSNISACTCGEPKHQMRIYHFGLRGQTAAHISVSWVVNRG